MSLKARLDALYAQFNCVDSATDPIQIARRFTDPADRELRACCSRSSAWWR
jgi:hypothetical protein